jgi:CxxC motif-containing protein
MEIQWTVEGEIPRVAEVAGNLCAKGDDYAIEEITAPKRTVTTTVQVSDGKRPLVSVRTAHPIPMDAIKECLAQLRSLVVLAPVRIGETLVDDIAGTGTAVVATRNVDRKMR